MKIIPAHQVHIPQIIELEQAHPGFIIPHSETIHQHNLDDPDFEYRMVLYQDEVIGFFILKGLRNREKVIDLNRMVMAQTDQGAGRRTLRWIKQYVFETLFAKLLTLDVFTDNYRAQTLYLTEGFRYEGLLRKRFKNRDLFQLSLSDEDYETAIPQLQEKITLESDRVYLRPLRSDDGIALQHIANNPELWGYGSAQLTNEAAMERYIDGALGEKMRRESYPFLIFDKAKNKAAGSSRYCNINLKHKRIEIGYTWLGSEFHGTGLNTHLKWLMLSYAFEQLQVNRVELKTDTRNVRSQRAMIKIGAKPESVLRKHTINFDGYVRDSIFFSILAEEWPKVKANLEARL